MTDETDIWRVANLMAKHYGASAVRAAAQRAEELLAAGDVNAFTVWKRIFEATAELTRTTPGEGERVN
jgi:hypothetical protein